jgi:hypothetical protein
MGPKRNKAGAGSGGRIREAYRLGANTLFLESALWPQIGPDWLGWPKAVLRAG